MTSDGSVDVKEVVQIGQAQKAYQAMPENVQEEFDKLITAVQNGKSVRANDKTDLKGSLEGISELRLDDDGNTYTTYYAAEFDEVLFILAAGCKKSHQDGAIPREEIATLKLRLKKAAELYRKNKDVFASRYRSRERNRESEEKSKVRRLR